LKFETFEGIVLLIVKIYKENYIRDLTLSKAFGSDTDVVTDMSFLDDLSMIITNEFNDKDNWLDYLIFENLIVDNYDEKKIRIKINGKEYPVTIKVIWDILNKKI